MATLNFNANTVEPNADFEAIPPGKYLAVVTESEMKPTKSGQGQYLQLTFQVLDGPFKGRHLWARLNLQNANTTTVQIARAELSALCRACGVMTPQDSVELHNIPVVVHVKVKKREDTGELTNEIKGYSKREAAPTSATPAQATTATPPWRR